MTIHLADDAPDCVAALDQERIGSALRLVLESEQSDPRHTIDAILAGDPLVAELNQRFRGKEGPTDVLSFALPESPVGAPAEILLGEIYVSLETAERQADARGIALGDEVARLVIHGALHLLGYDHRNDAEAEVMEPLEDRYWNDWRGAVD